MYEYRGPGWVQGDHYECTPVAPLCQLNSLSMPPLKHLAPLIFLCLGEELVKATVSKYRDLLQDLN